MVDDEYAQVHKRRTLVREQISHSHTIRTSAAIDRIAIAVLP